MAEVAQPKILAATIFITIFGIVLQVIILAFTMKGVGLDVPLPTLFLAYILPTMFGRISAVPGGVGVTEAGIAGFLSSTAGVDPDLGVAAAAIFRIATVFFQALLGALMYFFWWRGEGEQKRRAAS
jgi:uncharacterized protein (TIRG00374 family)